MTWVPLPGALVICIRLPGKRAMRRRTFTSPMEPPLRTCLLYTSVPLRAVAEALGFTVTWNGDGTVTVDSGEMHSVITIGEDRYQAVTSIEGAVGATGPLQLGAPPYVIHGTTYVPLKRCV